jgi:hypothetical protein
MLIYFVKRTKTMRFSLECGVAMFRSGLTKGIYENFLRSYHLDRSEFESSPFIYVDLDTHEVRFLTSLQTSKQVGSEIYAVSIASGGKIELLSTEAQ